MRKSLEREGEMVVERGRNGRESMTNQRVGAEKLDFQRGICIQYHQQTMQKKAE
jgi:hypothetical protein